MRLETPLTVTALSLVALLVVGFATQAAAVIVCVGSDGHVDIESAFEGCCIPGAVSHRGDSNNLSINAVECGDCTDVQLKAPSLRSKETQSVDPESDTGCELCSTAGVAARGAPTREMDQHWRDFKSLSTVVLLT